MTHQTNIEDIVKPLVWDNTEQDGDGFVEATANHMLLDLTYFVRHFEEHHDEETDNFIPSKTVWGIQAGGDYCEFEKNCSSMEEGFSKVQEHYAYTISKCIDPTKLHPAPFWKPMEQCPKVAGRKYDLWGKVGNIEPYRIPDCKYYDNGWFVNEIDLDGKPLPLQYYQPEFEPIAFAEIPACEVQP